jgi:hypothetical protein
VILPSLRRPFTTEADIAAVPHHSHRVRRSVWSRSPVSLTIQKDQPLRLGLTERLRVLTTAIAAPLGERYAVPASGPLVISSP